jgi:hypothetical protein
MKKLPAASFKDAAQKLLLGQIVLTRYNNSTMRIDDIDWTRNPQAKFDVSTFGSTQFNVVNILENSRQFQNFLCYFCRESI